METQVLLVVLLSVLSSLSDAQSFHPGRCPVPPVQQGFDVARYLGRWYDIQKLPAFFQKGSCGQASYTLRDDGEVDVLNQALQADGEVKSTVGKARVADPENPAKLEVTFFEGLRPGPYWVLATDHDGFALVYSCSDYLGLFHVDFAWILSRQRSLPTQTLDQLHRVLTDNGIKVDKMTTTQQTDCGIMPA